MSALKAPVTNCREAAGASLSSEGVYGDGRAPGRLLRRDAIIVIAMILFDLWLYSTAWGRALGFVGIVLVILEFLTASGLAVACRRGQREQRVGYGPVS